MAQLIRQEIWDQINEITEEMNEDKIFEIIEELQESLPLHLQRKLLKLTREIVQEMEDH